MLQMLAARAALLPGTNREIPRGWLSSAGDFYCGTIDHELTLTDNLNSILLDVIRGSFCNQAPIPSELLCRKVTTS